MHAIRHASGQATEHALDLRSWVERYDMLMRWNDCGPRHTQRGARYAMDEARPEDRPQAFGPLLRLHRMAAGWTQAQLAERAGLSKRGINDLERGARRTPHRATVALLVAALDLSASDRACFEAVAARARHPVLGPGSITASAREPRSNLPLQPTRFVGRAHEMRQLTGLLATARLFTLTGPGGSGKTRLAIEVAASTRARFPDGVWLVELAGLSQAALVPHAVATVLELPEQPDRAMIQTLVMHLKSRSLLLVLDNCEHLADACAALAATLLGACPGLRILATSRESLRIPGEVVWRISSLRLPDPERLPALDALSQTEAVELFLDRAQDTLPGFSLTPQNAPVVAHICYRLDGIPLALELAAGRVAVLGVEQIAAGLDDCIGLLTRGRRTVPGRHQTLQALLYWSYDLLTVAEQKLFRGLAVFAGPFPLAAVKAVGDVLDLAPERVVDVLAGLVDKSLILAQTHGGAARYRMLEPIRQYAWHQLEASGAAATVRARHREWCLGLAQRADAALWGAAHQSAMAELKDAQDNLRAALDWCVRETDETAAGLRLAGALDQYWHLCGHFTESRRWLERLLAHAPERTLLRARALRQIYGLAIRQFEFAAPSTRALLEESAAICRELGDARELGATLRLLGVRYYLMGRFDQATDAFAESQRCAQTAGDRAALALALSDQGACAHGRGDFPAARADFAHAAARLRELADQPAIASCFINLMVSEVELTAGGSVILLNEETTVVLRVLGSRACLGYTLVNLGTAAHQEGDAQAATAALHEAVTIFERLGDQAGLSHALSHLGNWYRARGKFARGRVALERSLGLRRTLGDQRGIGRASENLALLAMCAGERHQAEAWLDASGAIFDATNDTVGRWWNLGDRALLALLQRDYERAHALYEACLAITTNSQDYVLDRATILWNLGVLAHAEGDVAAARAQFGACLPLFVQTGNARYTALAQAHMAG